MGVMSFMYYGLPGLLVAAVVCLLGIILSSIVLSWVNQDLNLKQAPKSTKNTAWRLSVAMLMTAIITMLWTIFKIVCGYTPLRLTPFCLASSLATGGVKGLVRNASGGKVAV